MISGPKVALLRGKSHGLIYFLLVQKEGVSGDACSVLHTLIFLLQKIKDLLSPSWRWFLCSFSKCTGHTGSCIPLRFLSEGELLWVWAQATHTVHENLMCVIKTVLPNAVSPFVRKSEHPFGQCCALTWNVREGEGEEEMWDSAISPLSPTF